MDVEKTENEPNLDALIEAGEEIVGQINREVMFEKEYGPGLGGCMVGAPFSSDVYAKYRNWSEAVKKYTGNHSDSVFLIDVETFSADSAFEKIGDPRYSLSGQLPKPEIVELKTEITRLISGQIRALKKYRVECSNKMEVKKSLPKISNGKAPRIVIHVDRKLGIFCNVNGGNLFYPRLKPVSNIFKTILLLVDQNEPVEINKLASHTNQEGKCVRASLKRFNINFRRIFDVKMDPIKGTDNGIYFADRSNFDFL